MTQQRRRVSVVMCTYNGARYVEDQLRSILGQTVPPDELIVCDDRSTDDTVAVVRSTLARAPFGWQLHLNEHNLGAAQNFGNAVQRAVHEIVVLADQDDIWRPDKIREISATFDGMPELLMAFSNGRVVDEAGDDLGYDLWSSCLFDRPRQRLARDGKLLDVLLRNNVVTGASMAFSRTLVPLVCPIPEEWLHDEWIALVAASLGRTSCIATPLIEYRAHTAQQVGAERFSIARQIRTAKKLSSRYDREYRRFLRLRERIDGIASDEVKARIDAKVEYQRRLAIARSTIERVYTTTMLLAQGAHGRFGMGPKSWLADVVFGRRGSKPLGPTSCDP